ncbi:magnesium-translocating P-type ATPase [Spirosoma aureum]|uniref:Magnesium-transporting ATPase, P-type 1 n=1 Tax=Spirosoma aureum TaxID=2692134 RepID=A0A6G9ART2_9BACT|nr:magnesium-translocating P-type ATPase [Spirosoma aureum]QIP15120.1 magnesium-translocating P-type ATPase [Spirosoma aureum]
MDNLPFSSPTPEQLYHSLHSSPNGLTAREAAKCIRTQRQQLHTESSFRREFKLLVRQFTNPLVLLLVVAVILSAMLGETSDMLIILAILLVTGFLGFWQELNAGRAIEKLRSMIAMKHTILRDGNEKQVRTEEIVPGDVVIFDAGDIIPADCRILESNELHVDESSLTGETYPVEKMAGTVPDKLPLNQKTNCLWQGTNVISGTARAIAVQTGSQTLFGQMAHSLTQTQETAFEKGIKHFGYFLLRITITLSLVILAANLYFKKPFFDSVLFSLALAIGMAPELLPAIMTFAMSAGAKRMLDKKVIVKKLSSIFNFGEVTILCTDKTGTITEGTATVNDMVNWEGKTDERARLYAYLNASLQKGFTNPIDKAIASLKLSVDDYRKLDEIPYDFIRKRLSIAVQKGEQRFFVTKGALSNILDVCSQVESQPGQSKPINDSVRRSIEARFAAYCQAGYRVLGLAYKVVTTDKISRADETQMTFLGYILLEDPLKESALASLNQLRKLQVAVKIITGDNRFAAMHTAQAIANTTPVILTGDVLDQLTTEALTVKVLQTDVFAEIEPRQKERIIKALQLSGATVAYIGDGINDVAAIHAADVGISTSNAVDVAQEAADFVLLEKDLSVLADGILEGRKSFANSMKYIFITTGATFGNMFSVAGASLLLSFLPMLPKQILLTNLITDLPFLTIASDEVDDDQLTRPLKWDMNQIRNFMIVFGLHSSLFDFITFYTLFQYFHLSGSPFQTGWFIESSITELLILFIIRTRHSCIKSRPGKWLVITGLLALLITIYLPVSPLAPMLGFTVAHVQQVVALILILITYVVTADWLKVLFFRFNKEPQPESGGLPVDVRANHDALVAMP